MNPLAPLPVIDVVPVLRARCGWCKRLLRDGALPETTGICALCASELRPIIRAQAQVRANEEVVTPRVLAWKKDRGGSGAVASGLLPRALPGLTASEGTSPLLAGGIPRAAAAGRPDRDEPARPTRFLIESPARLRTFWRDNWATVILVAVLLLVSAWHTFMGAR